MPLVREEYQWWYDRVRDIIRNINDGHIDTVEVVAKAFEGLRYGIVDVCLHPIETYRQIRKDALTRETLGPRAMILLAPYMYE
jgi:hypothetical protein